ncbi:hypothetical protein 1 [Changjiang tombus-like virus 15]|uniref:hypothetical protein 1 n=1 Tax=Changjiang tombus-like virus 15 TaxID=1922808 RepID=UPI00090ACD7A|nr:hypothetical protein 1 [Changjiang tombus-like virus 15]APG76254.1 hypothetical protein 1 [Changjiang tombus-like virus 15]
MPPGVECHSLGLDMKGRHKERYLVMDTTRPAAGLCFTHNNSVPNILRGLGERLMMVPNDDGGFSPPPEPTVFDLGEYSKAVLRKMPKHLEPLEHDEFVMLYDGPKRKRYEAAARALLERELDAKDWQIKLFIKDEIVCSWAKADPAPRLISPRSPEYCLEVGCFIKPIEHLLYKAVARVWGETTIAKGLNFNQRGELIKEKWNSFKKPVAVGLDASRFDQHVSLSALQWEHSIYLGCFPKHRRRLQKLLSKQLRNFGVCYVDDHRITYSRDGGRMSGDMNTALGNCLIMTGLVWTYAKQRGITVKLINDGDDCVVFMEESDLPAFMEGLRQWFLERGFNMKVEQPAYELEAIEFCQCHPVFNGDQYTMCRNIHKALFTDVAHVGRTAEEIRGIREAVALCGAAWSKGLPIFPTFYAGLRTGHKPSVLRHSGTFWNSQGCKSGTKYVTPRARLSFERAFGLSPSEQVAIENFYQSLPRTSIDEPHLVFEHSPTDSSTHHPLFVSDSLNYLLFNHGKEE